MKLRAITARWLLVILYLSWRRRVGPRTQVGAPAQSPSGDLQRSITLFQQGKFSEAHQELLAATQRNPSLAEFLLCGDDGPRLHHPAAAEKNLRHALTLDPRSLASPLTVQRVEGWFNRVAKFVFPCRFELLELLVGLSGFLIVPRR